MCVIRPLSVKQAAKITLLLLLLFTLVTSPWSLGTDKKVQGCQPKETWVGHSVCLQSPHSLNLKVLYFVCRGVSVRWYRYMDDLETSFGMVLDHYIRSVHLQPSIRMYLHIPSKACNFFIFSDRLKLVFIPVLRFLHSVIQNGYMQLQVRDIQI